MTAIGQEPTFADPTESPPRSGGDRAIRPGVTARNGAYVVPRAAIGNKQNACRNRVDSEANGRAFNSRRRAKQGSNNARREIGGE
ncbi:MAG: hypothetical protein WAO95_10780 [Burkholderiales bacterium]